MDQTSNTGSMDAQNILQDLHKDVKNTIPKEPTRYPSFTQTNYQRTRNQPTFASGQIFEHTKKILTVYDSLLA